MKTVTKMILTAVVIATASVAMTGCKNVNMYTAKDEVQMGKEAAQAIEKKDVKLSTNSADNHLIQTIGKRLVSAVRSVEGSSADVYDFTFKVVEDKDVNAFSLPGGPVYVNSGLIRLAAGDADMIASVMGHEMAHVTRRHAAKQLSSGKLMGAVVAVGLGSSKSGIGDVASIASGMTMLKYSRDDEYQADEYGLKYLYKAGYRPEAALDFFTRMESAQGKDHPGFMVNLRSHPVTGARIDRLRKQIALLPAR